MNSASTTPASSISVAPHEIDSYVDRAEDIRLASLIDRALRKTIGRTASGDTYDCARCPLSREEERTVVDSLRVLSHRVSHGVSTATEPLDVIFPYLERFSLWECLGWWEELRHRVQRPQTSAPLSPA